MTDNSNFLNNKNIIVTGASSGIGKQTCIELSKCHANVVLVGREESRLKKTLKLMDKGNHKLYSFDLEKVELVSDFAQTIFKELKSIDGLVYCAGTNKRARFKDLSYEMIISVMKVNFFSFVELVRELSIHKEKKSPLNVVSISSLASTGNDKYFLSYSASKASMESAVRVLSNELKPKNICLSCLRPGYVDTPFLNSMNELYGDFNAHLINEGYQPQGIIPSEVVCNTIVRLLSSEAKYFSGAIIPIPAGANY